MTKLEFIQRIGNVVCEDCGHSDCGLDPTECNQVQIALQELEDFLSGKTDDTKTACGG